MVLIFRRRTVERCGRATASGRNRTEGKWPAYIYIYIYYRVAVPRVVVPTRDHRGCFTLLLFVRRTGRGGGGLFSA